MRGKQREGRGGVCRERGDVSKEKMYVGERFFVRGVNGSFLFFSFLGGDFNLVIIQRERERERESWWIARERPFTICRMHGGMFFAGLII